MITRQSLQIGAIRIEPDRNLIIKGNDTYSLEPRIMDVLYVLASNAGTVLSRDDLIDLVWKVEHGADESLTRAISVIRKTIRSAGEDEPYIETIPRRGYRLAQPVALIDAPTEPEIPVLVPPDAPVASTPALISTAASSEIAEKNISNMWRPNYFWLLVGGLIALLGIFFFWPRGEDTTGSTITANSVVVLPFSNLSGDPEFDYMTRGISAELRSELMRNEALKVVAQHTSKVVKTSNLDSKEIAEQLGVAFILDGNLTRTNDGLNMSAELINAKTGYSQWSKNYFADEDRLLEIQKSMVGSIVQAVTKDVDDLSAEGLGAPRRAAAFNAYLQGREAYRSAATPEQAEIALGKFDEAISSDPEFASAYVQRALILSWQSNSSTSKSDETEKLNAAVVSAKKAVQLVPDLAETQSTLGWVEFFSAVNISEAEDPFEQSLKLGGGDASILARYAYYAALVGKFDKAREAINSAIELDPLNSSMHRIAAIVHFHAEEYSASRESIQAAIELGESFIWYWAGLTELQLGNTQEAISYCEKELIESLQQTCLGLVSARTNDTETAEEFLSKLGNDSEYQRVQLLTALGRYEEAMSALNSSVKMRDPGLVTLMHDPILEPLRDRDDFYDLLLNLGFIDGLP